MPPSLSAGRPARLLYYEGTEITDYVDIKSCIHRDVSGGRADGLDILLDNAARWFAWGPKRDDRILASHKGYDTGIMYISQILPEDGKFRLRATSAPSSVKRRAWNAYQGSTLAGIMRACAAECGLEWAVFGLDKDMRYPFILRKNEGVTAFLQRLTEMEGGTLKCLNRRLTAIGIEYAQGLPAKQNLEIDSKTPGFVYRNIAARKWESVAVASPYGTGAAFDGSADTAESKTYTNLPAFDKITAGRWARGLLLCNNRTAEEMEFSTAFNPGMSAMVRVDVTSPTDAHGEWIIDEARHDFIQDRTWIKMLRSVTSIR